MSQSTRFISITLIAIISLHFVSCLIYAFVPSLYLSRQLLEYQKEKMNVAPSRIETVIVGDSSGGNAINASLYSELSNENTLNLCLTGSFGIIGSGNMLEKAIKQFPNLQTVIMIQTLDIWGRDISRAPWWLDTYSFSFSTLSKNPLPKWRILAAALKYYFTTNHIKLFLMSLFAPNRTAGISESMDFIAQAEESYANDDKTIPPDATLNNTHIRPENFMALQAIDKHLEGRELSVFFIHGPLHEALVSNSTDYINKINRKLAGSLSNITFIPRITSLPNQQTGDSVDHTAPPYKDTITKRYHDLIKGKAPLKLYGGGIPPEKKSLRNNERDTSQSQYP